MSRTVIFTFGRFQPPTIGHGAMLDIILNYAASEAADHAVFVSKTHDRVRNPLPIDFKINLLRAMFVNVNFIPCDNTVRTPVEAVKSLNKKYDNIVVVLGSDRIASIGEVIKSRNEIDYQYQSISIISAGDRSCGHSDISSASATAARLAALNHDFIAFRRMIPTSLNDECTKSLMEMISNSISFQRNYDDAISNMAV
jgi:nicotinamide mononucleotide adenylyltransferase